VNIRLVRTCAACPEQYDTFLGDMEVGYIRLRWGELTVRCPDYEGQIVYSHDFNEEYKGSFDDDEESAKYLALAVAAIEDWLKKQTAQTERGSDG